MTERPPPAAPLRLLYVEDDDDAREMLQFFLEMNGYDVATASSVSAALAALRTQRFHLVITDYNLSDANAGSLLARAKEEGVDHAPWLVVTASHHELDPALRVFRKPIDPRALLVVLDDILRPAAGEPAAPVVTSLRSQAEPLAASEPPVPAVASLVSQVVPGLADAPDDTDGGQES